MGCYSGSNPVKTIEDGLVIWRWAKENAIDHGMPLNRVHDMINMHFFAGQGKGEWINEILSGRKTPFRELANDVWRKQYNRRQIVAQAKNLSKAQEQNPVVRTIGKLWNIPRSAAVFGHGTVFPVTHAGDLALRPGSWGVFFKGLLNTWTKSWSPAATERLLDSMKRQPLFDTALRSGLDVSEGSHTDQILFSKKGKGSPGERAWSILKAMRFELWNHEMEKYVKPGMAQAEVLDVGKNLAEWANHATGSAKGPISNLGGNVLFGPKLTQSKLNRMFSDPVKTVKTFANWNNASAGEKAAAWTRLSGMSQYFGTAATLLAVNQGVLWATGQKDKDGKPIKINWQDPIQSDWLAFKGGGLEWSIPGMHSEIKTLGNILAVSFANSKDVNKITQGSKHAYIAKKLGQWAVNKANPVIGLGKETLTGQDYFGRPLPWTGEKGTLKKPPYGWAEYLLSHGPIPLTGPIRYIYDQLRAKGSNALDAMSIVKGLILYGTDPETFAKATTIGIMGVTGLHVQQDPADKPQPSPKALKAERAAHRRENAAAKRDRAARALQAH